ncbi:MAG: HAMP domain-containing protein, partial [Acidobacteria bacterium]|nr:HAMP domain-containing protein [Acidobacteriota bacterium]
KFVLSFFVVILAATVVLDFLISGQVEQNYTDTLRQGLEEKASLLADRVGEAAGLGPFARRAAAQVNARVTIIAADGAVLADSQANPSAMENHAGRPEFAAALRGEAGSSTRFSETIRTNFLYVAVPLRGGGALRLAYPLAGIDRRLAGIRRRIVIGSGLAVLAAMLLAALLAASISRRLNRVVDFARAVAQGRLTARIPVDGADEISMVMEALNRTADQLEESFSRLAESGRQLEAVLEAMEEGVIAVDAQKRIVCANRALCRLLRAEIQPGKPLDEAIPDPEIRAALERAVATHTATAADVRHGEPARSLKLSCSPMARGAVAVLYDVTDLERLENMRKDFVANVSHELRTPLTSIQGYAETLLESSLVADPRAREFVEIIRKHAARMAKLTADLLTLSRIELGRHEFRFAPMRAVEAIEWAMQSFEQVARARQVDLVADENGEAWVMADSDALHQALLNLLDNALKYTPPGGRVRVSARPVKGMIEFCVADTGAGIDAEHLPRLFERFYRADKARSRELGGTGLGLSIVKHIARAHGGDVRVESELGRGSSFFFTVSAAVAATEMVERGS